MSTATNQKLIEHLLQRLDMPQEELALFIEGLNDVFLSQLVEKKEVTIERLGVFRLVWSKYHKNQKLDDNAPRQYYRLKFEPEKSLKELVNKEFEFLPVVDLDEEATLGMPMNLLSKQAEEIKDILSEIQDSQNSNGTNNININEEENENSKGMSVEKGAASIEHNNMYIENVSPSSLLISKAEEQPKPFYPETERPKPEPTSSYNILQPDLHATDSADNTVIIAPRRNQQWLWCTVGLVGVAAVIAIWVIIKPMHFFSNKIPIATIDSTEYDDTFTLADSIGHVATSQENDTLFFSQREYSDFIDTVRIEAGVTLVQLALKYYEDKRFWIYIYEANRDVLSNANNVTIGTKIRIPKMAEVFINQSDTFVMNKVKKLEYYYAK